MQLFVSTLVQHIFVKIVYEWVLWRTSGEDLRQCFGLVSHWATPRLEGYIALDHPSVSRM